jgi:cytoskeleton protein RodZ
LRAERERAGLTIEQISARTRIKVGLLRAIEQGDFERLPGEFFTRAFLRTYARELRLSPDEIVEAYAAAHPTLAPVGEASAARSREVANEPSLRRIRVSGSPSAWPLLAVGTAVLAAVFLINRSEPDRSADPAAVGTAGVAELAQPPGKPTPPVAPEKLRIEIRPTRVMWVAGAADGERVIYRLVEPGEHVRLEARHDFWFRVGDAGAFEYALNGAPGKSLGRSGEVREVQITRDNLHTFRP